MTLSWHAGCMSGAGTAPPTRKVVMHSHRFSYRLPTAVLGIAVLAAVAIMALSASNDHVFSTGTP